MSFVLFSFAAISCCASSCTAVFNKLWQCQLGYCESHQACGRMQESTKVAERLQHAGTCFIYIENKRPKSFSDTIQDSNDDATQVHMKSSGREQTQDWHLQRPTEESAMEEVREEMVGNWKSFQLTSSWHAVKQSELRSRQ